MVNKNNSEDKIIGFPRGMSYYEHYPFWYGFFNSLGICIAFYFSGKSFLITFMVVSLLGYLITYAGYLMILFKKDGRGIHDMIGVTKVVEVNNGTCES